MANKAVQLYQLVRSTRRERRLGTVIFFVTSRCNARCQTCFYHEELNRPGDLSFEEIERVSRTMPQVTDLWLSGGEPTLRHDAAEIVDLFVRNNGVRRLIVPTNGLIKERAQEIVAHALGTHDGLHLYLNVALDGYGETHDRVRGDAPAGDSIKQVPEEALPGIYARAAALTEAYGARMFAADDRATRLVKQVAYVGAITTHYRTQHQNFARPTPWGFPCTAGETSVVIDYDGGVRACELRGQFASLRDYGCDFGALWADGARREELSAIDGGRACWCTHVCFIHDSMRHSRRALLWGLPRNYLTRARW